MPPTRPQPRPQAAIFDGPPGAAARVFREPLHSVRVSIQTRITSKPGITGWLRFRRGSHHRSAVRRIARRPDRAQREEDLPPPRRAARASAYLICSRASRSLASWHTVNAQRRPRASRRTLRAKYGTLSTKSKIRPLETPLARSTRRSGSVEQAESDRSRRSAMNEQQHPL